MASGHPYMMVEYVFPRPGPDVGATSNRSNFASHAWRRTRSWSASPVRLTLLTSAMTITPSWRPGPDPDFGQDV